MGWNPLAFLPVNDVISGFIKLKDDNDLPQGWFILKHTTLEEKEAKGPEDAGVSLHFP